MPKANKNSEAITTTEASAIAGVTIGAINLAIFQKRLKAHKRPGTRNVNWIYPQDLYEYMKKSFKITPKKGRRGDPNRRKRPPREK
jgi:hypothetical protein